MFGFSEQNFDVTNYSSVISSISFSKFTKFFNNCLIEPALIITKSRAKLKVILSENYCIRFPFKLYFIINLPYLSAGLNNFYFAGCFILRKKFFLFPVCSRACRLQVIRPQIYSMEIQAGWRTNDTSWLSESPLSKRRFDSPEDAEIKVEKIQFPSHCICHLTGPNGLPNLPNGARLNSIHMAMNMTGT